MKASILRALLLLVACAAAPLARAQENKDGLVSAGHDFALKVCANCHVVAKDQKAPPLLRPPAPPFKEIVQRGDITETSLRNLLASPHGDIGRKGKMPNPQLADYQIDRILAYFRFKGLATH